MVLSESKWQFGVRNARLGLFNFNKDVVTHIFLYLCKQNLTFRNNIVHKKER